jgi:hypothetical protein
MAGAELMMWTAPTNLIQGGQEEDSQPKAGDHNR